jgi:hypothetical protein
MRVRHLGLGLVVSCLVASGYGCSSPSSSGTDARDAKVSSDGMADGTANDRSDATADKGTDSGGGTGGMAIANDAGSDGAGGAAGNGDAATGDGATETGGDAGKDVTPNGDGHDGAAADAGADSGPPAPTCIDLIKNGDETDIDCGGAHCPSCGGKKICVVNSDCVTNSCRTGLCDECIAASDCPGVDTECRHRTCTTGTCAIANATAGVPLAQQTVGDCKVRVCTADGTVDGNKVDTTDTGDQPNPCITNSCNASGTLLHTPVAAGTACGTGGLRCNDTGVCVNCLADSDCPADSPATACRKPLCKSDGTCGFTILLPPDTRLTDTAAGDCHVPACDAAGLVHAIVDTNDKPDDQNPCTIDQCAGDGVTSHAPVASGVSCQGTKFCDGANSCVQCVSAGTCTGSVNECQTRTCIDNVCGVGSLPTSTVLAQTANDCKTRSCDGAGAVTVSANGQDLPVDDGNPCTDETCNGTSPAHPPFPLSHVCGRAADNHDLFCDGAGACIGCLTAADCPGSDTECFTRVCDPSSRSCTPTIPTAGTPITQILGNCASEQCDGHGGFSSPPNPNDPAIDTNECTDDVCAVPPHPAKPAGTACGLNSLQHCNGSSSDPQCVDCVVDMDCDQTADTICNKMRCVTNHCQYVAEPATTPVPDTTPGDCHINVCDAAGGVTSIASDDLDIPTSTLQCVSAYTCVGGTPVPTYRAHGTSCTEGGGRTCDFAGSCLLTFSVLRVGPGSPTATLSNAVTPVFIEERAFSDGSLIGSPVALPTAETSPVSSRHAFGLSGTASSDGGLSLSGNGKLLVLAGYSAPLGTPAVASTQSMNTSRIIATVDAAANVDTSTLLGSLAFNGNNIRSATSDDGSGFWAGGAGTAVGTGPFPGGVWYIPAGQATPAPTQIYNAGAVRWLHVIGGQLFGSFNQAPNPNVFRVGTGLPTTTGQTLTSLPGMPTGSGPSPFSFVAFDRDSTVPGIDLLYVADDNTGSGNTNRGIQKWTAAGTTTVTWTRITIFNVVDVGATPIGFRGLAGVATGSDITLIATTIETGANQNRLVKFVDLGAAATTPVSGTVLAGPSSPLNQVYRGVALSPHL